MKGIDYIVKTDDVLSDKRERTYTATTHKLPPLIHLPGIKQAFCYSDNKRSSSVGQLLQCALQVTFSYPQKGDKVTICYPVNVNEKVSHVITKI